MAMGGETVTTTVEGRERYGVAIRYPRDLRSDPQAIAREVQVSTPSGASVPLGEVASIERKRGATSIRTENGELAVYIFVDTAGRDLGGYVRDAQDAISRSVKLPAGYRIAWSGQFEYLERAEARLKLVVPVTLAIIFLLLYLNFRRLTETIIVMLSLPFALVGGVWLLWWLGFNMSVAVAVGFIALAGVAAETGVIMLIYLDHALVEVRERRSQEGKAFTRADLHEAIMLGAVERVRPKIMTVVAIMAGLLPILWNTGTGSEVMQRIAVPMIGGMVSSTVLTLLVIPAIYGLVKGWRLPPAKETGSVAARPCRCSSKLWSLNRWSDRHARHDERHGLEHGGAALAHRRRAAVGDRRLGKIRLLSVKTRSRLKENKHADRYFAHSPRADARNGASFHSHRPGRTGSSNGNTA